MTQPEGAFHRAPRPLILWAGALLVIGGTLFALAILAAIALGFWKTAAEGRPVPDLSGGLGVLAGAFATVGGFIWQVLSQRHRERMDQQARGTAPNVPFDSSPPFEGVNPHGGPNAP